MKNLFYLTSFILLLPACKKKHECTCYDTYSGYYGDTKTLVKDTLFRGLKTEEAEEACTSMNVGPQTIGDETWGILCELK